MTFAPAATISIEVEADPLTAFEVFTEDIGRWYRVDDPRFVHDPGRARGLRVEPTVGGRVLEIYDEAGAESHEYGRVLAWEPGKRLVFEWRISSFEPDRVTHVQVEFEPTRSGTRVALQHRGWEALPPEHPAKHGLTEAETAQVRALGWAEQLGAFKVHVERDGRAPR